MSAIPDEHRARSFGAVSEHYDRFRPGPPAEALDWLLPEGARDVVDLGAGTGALTRLLVDRVANVTAVEPDDRMREVLEANVPRARALAGRGEELPVADASQDAIVASSAWHWVDPQRAVPEAARALRPGGHLGVMWGGPDRDDPAMLELWRTLRPDRADPAFRPGRRMLNLPEHADFEPVEGPHFVRYTRRFTREELIGWSGTFSVVILLSDDERAALDAHIRRALDADPRFDDPEGVELAMAAGCWRAIRR